MYEFMCSHPIITLILVYILCKFVLSLFRIIFNRENNSDSYEYDGDIIINGDNYSGFGYDKDSCSCNSVVIINGKRYCCLKRKKDKEE
jgi:hypothetical protein